jgi:cyclophilin family peptidyl-prolyl cis-trans isomerase
MPRLGGGTVQQSYLIGFNDVDADNDEKHAKFTGIEPAPSSANSLTRITSLPRTPKIPAPSSLKSSISSSSMFTRPTHMMMSPHRQSPRRTRTISELPSVMSDITPRQPTRNILRAAEGGKGSLLPDYNSTPTSTSTHNRTSKLSSRQPPSRDETRSSPSLKQIMNFPGFGAKKNANNNNSNSPTLPQTQQDIITPHKQKSIVKPNILSLRRRAGTGTSDDEDGYSRRGGHNNDSPYRTSRTRNRRSTFLSWHKLSRMKLGHMLQVVIVLAVTALVWESHHKALFAAEQLSQFKEEESLLLLHLQKIEQQSIQLHENLSRLAQSGIRNTEPKEQPGKGEAVDFALIHKQTQQLYQMEEELNHEVRTLQTRIQQSARNHIIQEFGEGPVQVVLEVDFGDNSGPDRISILLWHDTPHAAWTWLEQIGRHVWDDAHFQWQQGHVIDAAPIREDPLGGKIEFVEQSQHGHESWTVGLRESDTDTGAMSMYVNLQDNSNLHKHETCVGKVIDGFDALQRLLELSRSRRYEKDAFIAIRKATAMHVTKKEGVQ